MKARAWMAAFALIGAAAAYAPAWVVSAQDAEGKETENQEAEYATAKEMLGSLQEVAKNTFKDQRNPGKDELKVFFTEAFKRAANYLEQHPDAADRDSVYKWAGQRADYGYGHADYIRVAKAYLAEKKDAEDRAKWEDGILFARLGISEESKAAQEELKKAEIEAKENPVRRLELADLWLRHFGQQDDAAGKAELIEKLKKDEGFANSDNPLVQRRLMRTVLANVPQAEIKVGEAFPDWSSVVTVRDIEGKTISTADYKGKIVLLDFWAVWCGPCMKEMPNVIKLYEETHEQGFEVIGISLDMESGNYDLNALKETIEGKRKVGKMPWRQIYDGGYWSSGLAKYYNTRSIPRTVLIDQDGVVVAEGLRGKELDEKVKELLAKLETKEEGSKEEGN